MTAPTYLNTRTADMPTTEQLLREAVATLRAFIKPLRAMGHQSDAIDAAPDLMGRIDAYLAQQSALDELVRENERLGLYDLPKARETFKPTRLIEVSESFDALLTALNRAENKGYLPDAIVSEWEAFDYSPVHAAPAPAQPLSEEQILHFQDRFVGEPNEKYPITERDWLEFGRAIERAHGIGAITGEKP